MNWFWSDERDHARCAAFAPALADAQFSTLPWLSWSLRLSAEFGAPSVPEMLAVAVQLLNAPSQEKPASLALAVECLDSLALGRTDVASVLLAAQLLPAPHAIAPGAEELEPEGAPAHHAILWGLNAIVAKLDPAPWIGFAAMLAEPIALYQSLLALVDDIVREPGGPAPRLGPLLRAFANDRPLLEKLLDACAGALDDPRRLLECRMALANPIALKTLVAHREKLLIDARSKVPTQSPAPAEAFLFVLTEKFANLEHLLWLRLVMTHAQEVVVPRAANPRTSIEAAVAYLNDTRPWCSAWDVHRFHPLDAPIVLVNRLFIQGMILLALDQVDGSRHAEIEAVLDQIPDGDLRYFPDWPGLPPDSDSLGLMLQLAVQLPNPPRKRLDGWISLLGYNVGEDKLLPVWLDRGPEGPTATLPGPFLGNECTATRIAVLLALMRYDAQRFASFVSANLQRILAQYSARGFTGCIHYDNDFAEHLFLRLAAEFATRVPPALREMARDLGVDRVAGVISSKLIATQRIDGGWGSPQRTAFALEGLTVMGAAPEVLKRAVKYLVETQRPDGAWAAEPLYITPRKLGGMTPFAAKELTTALCVRALQIGMCHMISHHWRTDPFGKSFGE